MKKVVVIGGGFAGSQIVKKLEKYFDTTLIDTKNYFEFTPGILRTIVQPEHINKIQVLHSDYLKKTRIVIGKVSKVKEDFIIVRGKKIDFDYLVISSGSAYNAPFNQQDIILPNRSRNLRKYYKSLCKAKKIIIVGGGIVGVELAGEIFWRFGKQKEVTILHSKDRLIERNDIKASSYAKKYLKNKGAKIIFNERVIKIKDKKCITDKGSIIAGDLFFLCTGIKANFEFLKKNFSNLLNEKNQIIVDEFLHVKNTNNIFAAGDITDTPEEKTAQNAERQGRIVCKNILALEKNKAIKKYKPRTGPLIISFGKYNGLFVYKNFVFTGLIPGIMKTLIEKREMFKKRRLSLY